MEADGLAGVKVDGGSMFEDVKVNRGRSISPAIDT
jgi:hypothetical protein